MIPYLTYYVSIETFWRQHDRVMLRFLSSPLPVNHVRKVLEFQEMSLRGSSETSVRLLEDDYRAVDVSEIETGTSEIVIKTVVVRAI